MRNFFLISIFIFLFYDSYAQNSTITLSEKTQLHMIGKQVHFLEDASNNLTIQDILKTENQQKFQKHDKEVFARPASSSAFWFKCTIQNTSEEDAWLDIGTTHAWYIDFYTPDSLGNYKLPYLTGTMRPHSYKYYDIINSFWMPLNKAYDKHPKTYYLRIIEEMPFEAPLQVGTIRSLTKNKSINDALTAGFIGLMLIMILYNAFIYISTKDHIYGIYLGYLIAALFNSTFVNGYSLLFKVWMAENFLIWNSFTVFFIGAFCITYLKLAQNSPKFNKFIITLMCIISGIIPIMIAIGVRMVNIINYYQLLVTLFLFTCLFLSCYLTFKKQKYARFYALGWSFALSGAIVFGMVINGIVPFNPFTRNAMYFGIGLEVWMFSLALADRLNIMRKEKESAQQEALQIAEENEKIIKDQNVILEQKVATRTAELHEMNQELEVQNEEIRQHQEELMAINESLDVTYKKLKQTTDRLNSSIEYAKNIQEVILPEDSNLQKFFNDYFILYLPKDKVSGDFYWFSQLDANRAIFVLADCTGHGVPGAFMTVVGNTLLHEIIEEQKIYEPPLILPELHRKITLLLKQAQGRNIDGMDVSICLLEKEAKQTKITFSGAKTKMYYHMLDNQELMEFVGDKEFIGAGGNVEAKKVFTNHTFFANPGDILYLISDGYIDQNDQDRKRFGSARFKELLLEISLTSLSKQRETLHQTLLTHQGKEEQRDDITVVGLKL